MPLSQAVVSLYIKGDLTASTALSSKTLSELFLSVQHCPTHPAVQVLHSQSLTTEEMNNGLPIVALSNLDFPPPVLELCVLSGKGCQIESLPKQTHHLKINVYTKKTQ